MAGNCSFPEVKWWEPLSNADLQRWFDSNPDACKQYLQERAQEYREVQASLRPGEPNFLEFEGGQDSPKYQSELRMWESETVSERVAERHKPPAPPLPQPDTDWLSLSSPNSKDREMGKEMLTRRQFVKNQLAIAAQREGMGDKRGAQEARDRASMIVREIQKDRANKPYEFVQAYEKDLLEKADEELTQFEGVELTPEQKVYFHGRIEARNHESPEEFSFMIHNGVIRRVEHAGESANRLATLPGGEPKKEYLANLAYPTPKEEEVKEGGAPSLADATPSDYRAYLDNIAAKEVQHAATIKATTLSPAPKVSK